MDLNEDIMVFAEVQIKPVEVNLEKAIQHGLESRLELRQREIESKELAFDMIKTKALNELNLTRYREGDITGMDMNQFQTQLSNKKIAYTQALINYKIELLNLKILSLYDFEHDVPIVPMEDLVTKK